MGRQKFRTIRQSDRVAVPELFPRGLRLCRLHGPVSDVQPRARRDAAPSAVVSVCGHVLFGVYPCILPPRVTDILDTVENHDAIRIDDLVRRSIERCARPGHQRIKAKYGRAPTWCLPAAAATTCTATTVSIALASAEAQLARFGLVDLDVSAFEFGIVELTDGVGGFFRSRHLDKAEALRLSGELVRDDRGALHLAN